MFLKWNVTILYNCTVSCTVPGVHLVMYTNICITKTFSNKNSKFIHNKDRNVNIIYLFIQAWVFESLFMLPMWVLWVLVRCAAGWLVECYIHPRAIHPTCQDSILGEVPGGLRGGIPCRLWGGNRGRLRCGIQGRLWGGIRGGLGGGIQIGVQGGDQEKIQRIRCSCKHCIQLLQYLIMILTQQ